MLDRKRKLKLLVALGFWCLMISIHLVRALPLMQNTTVIEHIKKNSLAWSLDIVTFSIFFFFIVPMIVENRKRILAVFLGLCFWGVSGFIWGWGYSLYFGELFRPEDFDMIFKSSLGHTVLNTIYAIVLYLAVDWYFKRRQQERLEEENAQIKLSMLKAQINPHFLFNVLNNIHSLAHKDPDKTSDSIIKLSEIMRYMLYDSDQQEVTLDKEIDLIRSYLKLQRLRLIEPESVNFSVEGDTHGIRIAPLIFIAFIENAFKHGQKNTKNAIEISIKVEGDRLHLYCGNYIRMLSETEERTDGKIGLENIKRRLELLYEGSHSLELKQDNERFEVNLEITIR